jgi:Ca-activated chloride channel family protein
VHGAWVLIKDSKMEKLADKGNGNYSYIDNLMEAK